MQRQREEALALVLTANQSAVQVESSLEQWEALLSQQPALAGPFPPRPC